MSDWVNLARETADGSSEAADPNIEDDERYLDIRRVYDRFPRSPDVVVDVGANDGRATWRFGVGAGRTVIGIDVSYLLLKSFLSNLPDQIALQADGGCLPLEDECADFLFCTETLEHIPDPAAAVGEFFRVLKPGGWLMIQSPNAHRLRNLNPLHILTLLASLATDKVLQKKKTHENTWHNAITYHWDFSVQDYRRMIEEAGGSVLELRSAQFFVPRFLLKGSQDAFAAKERILSRIPLVRYLGADLVVVAVKND
jgi:ubiquinone/menaquinone biosynthesis C-methylase UbiE